MCAQRLHVGAGTFLKVVLLGCIAAAASACAAESDTSTSDDEVNGGGLTNLEAVARAKQWSDAKLQYCWAPNGGDNHKAGNYACAKTCSRKRNAQWDPYRSDCSGLVSWAWALPAPGRTTKGFFPFQKDITVGIQAKDLRPGDAVNNNSHIMLFKAWVTPGKRATFIEEPGCSSKTPYAKETTADVTISGQTITPSGRGAFTAIRYTKLTEGAAKAPPKSPPTDTTDDQTDETDETDNDTGSTAPPSRGKYPTTPGSPPPTEPEDETAPPPEPVTPSTTGELDKVSCEGLKGWAIGPNNTAVDIELAFFGERGTATAEIAKTAANVRRSDLPSSKADFGFELSIPLAVRDGSAHPIFAYAIAADGKATKLEGAQSTITCAAPSLPIKPEAGVRRLLSSKTMAAWKRTTLEDVLRQSTTDVDAFTKGTDFPAAPVAIRADDGSSEIWVVDGDLRRPIETAAIQAWRLAVTKRPAADVNKLTKGPAWPSAPFLVSADDGATVYALDAKLPENTKPSSTTDSTSSTSEDPANPTEGDGNPDSPGRGTGGEDEDDEGAKGNKKKMMDSSGCAQHGTGGIGSSYAPLLGIGLAVAALERRRRQRDGWISL